MELRGSFYQQGGVLFTEILDARRRNILLSPKKNGSCDEDALPYLRELGVEIVERRRPIQFTSNFSYPVHRWAGYIQGFSALSSIPR